MKSDSGNCVTLRGNFCFGLGEQCPEAEVRIDTKSRYENFAGISLCENSIANLPERVTFLSLSLFLSLFLSLSLSLSLFL